MRILDVNGFEVFDYDRTNNRLVEEKLFVMHHPKQEYVAEEGHYETIREYANGGKDVKWVVDVEGQEACDAWDEYEDVLRVTPFTDKEKAEIEINILKANLFETDYNIIKIMEGAATVEEKSEIIAQRAEWRHKINELEAQYDI